MADNATNSIRLLLALRNARLAQPFDDPLICALKVGSSLQWMPAQVCPAPHPFQTLAGAGLLDGRRLDVPPARCRPAVALVVLADRHPVAIPFGRAVAARPLACGDLLPRRAGERLGVQSSGALDKQRRRR